jgi:hypothetical protein
MHSIGTFTIIVAGISLFINVVSIIIKWKAHKENAAGLDFGVLALVMWLFNGSTAALIIAMIGSALLSIFLFFYDVEDLFE